MESKGTEEKQRAGYGSQDNQESTFDTLGKDRRRYTGHKDKEYEEQRERRVGKRTCEKGSGEFLDRKGQDDMKGGYCDSREAESIATDIEVDSDE